MSTVPTAVREQVVLLDDGGSPVGTADKSEVHHRRTPLHLAFSCHVLDGSGRLLVTRRALSKRTWPGVWTNSVCGHPAPGESLSNAVIRRARSELGIAVHDIEVAVPDFRYRAVDDSGTVENEVCPVLVATTDSDGPRPDPTEVMAYRWIDPGDLGAALHLTPWAFSPWLTEHAPQLPLLAGTAVSR